MVRLDPTTTAPALEASAADKKSEASTPTNMMATPPDTVASSPVDEGFLRSFYSSRISSSVCSSPSTIPTPPDTPAERIAAGTCPPIPVHDQALLPIRVQAADAPGPRDAHDRQTRYLVWQADWLGSRFEWKPDCKPTVDTACQLLAFYLDNPDLVRESRCLGLPLPAASVASNGQASLALVSVTPFADGAHNVLFEVKFQLQESIQRQARSHDGEQHCNQDGEQYCSQHANLPILSALLRIAQPEAPFHRLESDVATTTFVREIGISAPCIYSFDSSAKNPLGLEWALMEKMAGISLGDIFGISLKEISMEMRDNIMDDVVFKDLPGPWETLFEYSFTGLGSLYIDWEAHAYTLGPVVSQLFYYDQRLLCTDVDRGPYAHPSHYVRAQLDLYAWELRRRRGEGEEGDHFKAVERACEKMETVVTWAERVFGATNHPISTFLFHQDLHSGNIMINTEEHNKYQMTAILDWEDLVCVPLAFYAPPKVASKELGNCRLDREPTYMQLPTLDEIPLEVLSAAFAGISSHDSDGADKNADSGDGGSESKESNTSNTVEKPLSPTGYYARCIADLRARGTDFTPFGWYVPEYQMPPSPRAVDDYTYAGEPIWAALLVHVCKLWFVGLDGYEGLSIWLDEAFTFCTLDKTGMAK